MGKAKRNHNKAKPIKQEKRFHVKQLSYYIHYILRRKKND